MQNLFGSEGPGGPSQTVLGRVDQSRGPIPVQSFVAEQIAKESAQNFLNPLDSEDVSRGLLADKLIDMIHFQLVEIPDLVVVKKMVKTPAKQFDLQQGIVRQTLMLPAKIEVLTGFREKVVPADGLFQWKSFTREMSCGSCPAKKGPYTVLQADVVRGFKALSAVEAITSSGRRVMLDPVVDELDHVRRRELFQIGQRTLQNESGKAAEVSQATPDTGIGIAMGLQVGLVSLHPVHQVFHGFRGPSNPRSC